MEMFNAISTLVTLIMILGAITVGLFSAAWHILKCPQDRLASIIIYVIPCYMGGMISLTALVKIICSWVNTVLI